MILIFMGHMGTGKTLSAVALAYENKEKYEKIYANFKLNKRYFPNFELSKFLFLPYDKIGNCLIIADDFYNLQKMGDLTTIIASVSRKKSVDIIITIQDYIMVKRVLRDLSNWIVKPTLFKNSDFLYLKFYKEFWDLNAMKPSIRTFEMGIDNPIEKYGKMYNTDEVVAKPTRGDIIIDIIKYSKNLRDIELNIEAYTRNKAEQKSILKEIKKEHF